MSEDTGLSSVRRQRGTNSAIPQPPSAMKRQSYAPGSTFSGHGRSGSGSGSGSSSRQSLMQRPPSQTGAFGRASLGPGFQTPGQGTTQLRNSIISGARGSEVDRRSSSSVYRPRSSTVPTPTVGHQSFFQTAPTAAGVPRDPRPLKDRSYQARTSQELLEYLAQNNFEMEMSYTLSQNFTKSPTQRDFNYLFQWFYHRIEPTHKFQKNIDQEVPPLLKQMRYPYERSITKSQISAVGGQNWPMFLGLLHWMMQLAQMCEGYIANQYDYACAEAGTDVTGDRIIFKFLTDGYREWLCMDEEADEEESNRVLAPLVDNMARAFENHDGKYMEELATLEAENTRLQRELEELEKTTPDPGVLDKQFNIMQDDKVKFEEYNALAMRRTEKYDSRIDVLKGELDKLLIEVKDAEDERRGLQRSVDDLGIGMQDIDLMNSERDRLQRGIESAAVRLDDAKRRVADKESEASRKLDELERCVDRYNSLAYQIGLIPSTAANAAGRDFELAVTVGTASTSGSTFAPSSSVSGGSTNQRLLVDPTTGYQPGHILNLDLRGSIKSHLLTLRKEISDRRSLAIEAMMKDHDILDGIKEAIEDKISVVEALGHRMRTAEEEYEKTKEVTLAQKMASDAEIEKTEKSLSKMRADLQKSVQLLEQKEFNTNIEYEKLTIRANSLREELHTETERIINDIIKFKLHIQKGLEDYEGFVADELEKELATEMEGDGGGGGGSSS